MAESAARDGARMLHVSSDPGDAVSVQQAVDAADLARGSVTPVVRGMAADAASIASVVRAAAAAGKDDVHVVITLRPYGSALAATWRDDILDGGTRSYETWLAEELETIRYDVAVGRWLDQVPVDRVTVVCAEDPGSIPRTFERLLGLDAALDLPARPRTLTYGETELLRGLNEQAETHDWPDEVYRRYVRDGAADRVRRRGPRRDEQGPVPMPGWARERLAETAEKLTAAARGAEVVGDPAGLLPRDEAEPATASVRPRVAALAVIGAIAASEEPEPEPEDVLVRDLSAPALAGVIGRRLLARATSRAGRASGESRSGAGGGTGG